MQPRTDDDLDDIMTGEDIDVDFEVVAAPAGDEVVTTIAQMEVQLAAAHARNDELERELEKSRQTEHKAKDALARALAGRSPAIPIPLTETQRVNNERRRRRELMVMTKARLVELLMRADNRTRNELTKLSRETLIDLVIHSERKAAVH